MHTAFTLLPLRTPKDDPQSKDLIISNLEGMAQGFGSPMSRMPESIPFCPLSGRQLSWQQESRPRFSLCFVAPWTVSCLLFPKDKTAWGMAQELILLPQLSRSNRMGQGKEPELWE